MPLTTCGVKHVGLDNIVMGMWVTDPGGGLHKSAFLVLF